MLGSRTPALDTRSAKPATKGAKPFYVTREWRALVAEIIREGGARCKDPACCFFGLDLIEVELVACETVRSAPDFRCWRRARNSSPKGQVARA